ncbi:type II toxin-antitoxin system RelB/DinJ family antitoxin [Lactobacillus crispatus]|uniref:type II toxin-antitoxin system RelB/DinJ family antitoxin n=1 Tax=Lactobacillus crispatus TaxID=47770 RepID=UPI001F10F208|nr:type II toxin-antitoxin system RelB/DinJ family antitoxin [Lactobacillus crispatus]
MTEKAAINIRVNKETKQNAEKVLNKLGIPMSVAIDMYLRQIALTDGIPFDLSSKKRKMITKQQ